MNPLFFSIESRKGGVGKTTVALNVCQMLLEKGYAVLMLDCDITGTSSAESSENSEFWKENVNVIKYFDKKTNRKRPINILTPFCKRKTKESQEDEKVEYETWTPNNLDYNKDKINIIGSELYEGKKLIVDPQYLVDEIHSYWVISMLEELADYFFSKFEKAAIVIDNSPGYIGLGRAIHEWFTDLGPEKAHFLLVSSIDEQDVRSSISAAIEIKRLMEGKIKVAKYFKRLKDGEEMNSTDESFLKSDSHFDRFFYKLVDNENYPTGDYPLQKYAAIIFNKVLPECFEEDSDYRFSDVLGDNEEKEVLESMSDDHNINSKLLMIPYDPLVNTQFFGKHLHYKVIESQDYWIKRFDRLSKDVMKYLSMNDVVNAAFSLNGYLTRLKTSIDTRGSKSLAASIKAEWFPAYYMNDIRSIVDRIAYYSRPDTMVRIKDVDRKDIASFNKTTLDLFIKEKNISQYSPVLLSFLNHLNSIAGAKKDYRNIQLLIIVSLFFNILLSIHQEEFEGDDYRGFLIKEKDRSYKNDYSRYIGAFAPITKNVTITIDDFSDIIANSFDKFYGATCYALIRLIDLKDDYNLLVSVLEKQITSLQKNIIPIKVIDYLDQTIVKKDDSNVNTESIDKIYSDAYSMSIFENLLHKIMFKNWNL